MRKRNCDKWFDNLFWYSLYFLPILVALVTLLNQSETFWQYNVDYVSFDLLYERVFDTMVAFGTDNIVYTSLVSIFGQDGVIPMFTEGTNSFLLFFTWFVNVYIVHLMVDFILFIPRIAHKWLKKGYQED